MELGRDVLDAESLGLLAHTLHLNQRIGEIPVLHDPGVLADPDVQGGREVAEMLQLLLAFGVEERVAGRRLGEDVIQLGDIRNDRLLVWFGGINICKGGEKKSKMAFKLV